MPQYPAICGALRRFSDFAYAPRPGLGIDAATRRALEDMRVQYIDEPLNTAARSIRRQTAYSRARMRSATRTPIS